MDIKKCNKCGKEKVFSEFYKRSSAKDGLHNHCIECGKAKNRKYYQENKEKLKTANRVRLASMTKEERSEMHRRYYLANRDSRIEAMKEYRTATWEERKLDQRKRYHSDPKYRIRMNLTNRINKVFEKLGMPKRGRTRDIIGCDWDDLKIHIEDKFRDGMSWGNKGEWHIDHIVPLSSARTPEEMESLCHYTNLQPLWASENMAKGAKLDYAVE